MFRKIWVLVGMLLAVFVVGTLGYAVIEEDWSLFDAFYMTVISLTTVGYGETRPLTVQGRVFTVFLLLGGVGTLAYGISTTTAFLVGGQFTQLMRERSLEAKIQRLSGHIVVCGLGETGRHVAEEFRNTDHAFVAVETDRERIEARLQWTAPGLLDTRVRVFDLMRPPQLERVFPALPGPAFGSRSPRESNDGCTGS